VIPRRDVPGVAQENSIMRHVSLPLSSTLRSG
jgi:hypothetical protein